MSWSGLCNNLTSFDAGALINPTIFPLISSREGKVIDQAEVAKIASLPTLKEARAKIVGVLNASAQKLIGILLAQSKKMANLAPAEEIKK